MRNYIILNGISSNTISGLLISTLPSISKPKQRTQTEEIDGRDGDIVTKLGYSAYDKIIEIGLYGNFDINEVISYFSTEGTVVFSNEADKYYNYQILDQIDYDKLIRFKTATIKMHVQPFKYPLEEEQIQVDATVVTGTGSNVTLEYTNPNNIITTEIGGNIEQDGTPTPSSPVEIKTANGIQNLFDINANPVFSVKATATAIDNGIRVANTETGTGNYLVLYKLLDVSNYVGKKFSIKMNFTSSVSGKGQYIIGLCDENGANRITGLYGTTSGQLRTYTIPTITTSNYLAVWLYSNRDGSAIAGNYVDYTNIQVEMSDTIHSLVPYGHWLPIKVENKNLFDKDNASVLNAYLNNSTNKVVSNNSTRSIYVKCDPNTTYTISKMLSSRFVVAYTTDIPANSVDIRGAIEKPNSTSITITTDSNANYLVVYFYHSSYDTSTTVNDILNTMQVERGTTATDYEPHKEQNYLISSENIELCKIGDYQDRIYQDSGTWYIEKKIGKAVLDGSENWGMDPSGVFNQSSVFSNKYLVQNAYSNYFTNVVNTNIQNNSSANNVLTNEQFSFRAGSTKDRIYIKKTDITSASDFKAWLSTHNTEIYYVLSEPTTTEITDATLLGQLEELAGATTYETTTYVSTDGDAPAILKETTQGMPNTTITNIGNVYAKPLITIYGSGNIGVYLNQVQVLQIALGDIGNITIDVSKMEAYSQSSQVLLNRLVTGDYMNFLINSGSNNHIAFSGNVLGFTMNNYTRWL